MDTPIPSELELYQDWVKQQTSDKVPRDAQLSWALMGLAAELGEVMALYEKQLRKEGWVDYSNPMWKDELGDTLWYFAAVCNVLGLTIDDVIDHNVSKINRRIYGEVAQ